jgi:exodeoxyribonuclease V alpha subunit
VRVEGFFEEHQIYGKRFRVRSLERITRPTKEGLERYLFSGAVKGVGPVIATGIVEAFGDQPLSVIEDDRERLKDLHGIGGKKGGTHKA